MKAVRLIEPGQPLRLCDVPVPQPGRGDVLIRVQAAGICHSDAHYRAGRSPVYPLPLTLGHEGIGRVESVGPGVTDVAVGDRVGITFLAATCGECELCRSGRERYCARQLNSGYTVHGALANRAVVRVQYLARIPDSLSAAEADKAVQLMTDAGELAWKIGVIKASDSEERVVINP